MKSKEQLAMDYIFFRNPSYYIITLFPIVGGLIGLFFVSNTMMEIEGSIQSTSLSLEHTLLDTYLESASITLSFVISYFVIFKWVLMKTEGTYGFWITQGVSRRKYFIETVIKMVSIVSFSYFIGFLFFIFLAGIKFTFIDFIMFLLLVFSNIMIVFSLAILSSELITDPELAATIFLAFSGINIFFNSNYDSIFHKILLSDRHYGQENQFSTFVISILSALGLFFAAFQLHLRRGVDL